MEDERPWEDEDERRNRIAAGEADEHSLLFLLDIMLKEVKQDRDRLLTRLEAIADRLEEDLKLLTVLPDRYSRMVMEKNIYQEMDKMRAEAQRAEWLRKKNEAEWDRRLRPLKSEKG